MLRNNQTRVANPDNLKSLGASTNLSAGGASLHSRMKTVSMAALALALPAAVALAPVAARATPDLWTGSTSNAWETSGNWNAGVPATTSQVTIGSTTNNPVQLNSSPSLNGGTVATGGSLTINLGSTLNINSGDTLTMGNHTITLNGGSITGTGTVSNSGGTIQGYGTFSAQDTSSGTWNANSASGALTLSGTNTYHGTFTTSSGQGGFNLNGVTLSSISTSGTAGTYNLNGATINGATLNNVGGQFYVTGNSTLSGAITWNQYNTFNIGDGSGPYTLNLSTATLSTVTGGAAPFIIGAGGTLNNYNGASSMGGGGSVTLNGGSITNTSGTGSTTAGLFTVGDPISGYGTVSGNVAITAGNLFVNNGTAGAPAGQTLTLNGGSGPGIALGNSSSGPGISINGTGSILDLQGNITVPSATNMNPSGSVIKFDGANISHTGGSPAPINNSGLTTSGTLDVVNASTLNNIAFSTGNGANLVIDAPLTAQGGATVNATNVTIHGTGSLDLLDTTGTTALTTKNFTMAQGALLHVGAGADGISITGNFSFQQTNPSNWTYGSTAGLGPDLTMRGGTSTSPTTLEVGGINLGYLPAGFIKNFALASLTLGTTGYVDLVDQYANATPSGWTSGSEALYLDNLFGTSKTSYGTLNLDGLSAYLQGYGPLQNGIFTDANGNLVDIVGAPVPEPATITMMLTGFSSLLCLATVRRRKSEIARATPYGVCRRRHQPCP